MSWTLAEDFFRETTGAHIHLQLFQSCEHIELIKFQQLLNEAINGRC